MRKVQTLCLIVQDGKILLGMKKRGFGQGRWNGFGGKVSDGEAVEVAAAREVLEEVSIVVNGLEEVGVVDFRFPNSEDIMEVHIFKPNSFSGEPQESEEMRPQWFGLDEIPFAEMWSDDEYWFPLFLNGKKFKGRFLFDSADNILEHELTELS
ncbi:TPA: DNA mismatch repair protein MutT [Patescibacteria group bacterium]|nr:DNA mismatch repair protein MutT [Patescibacteria group bacterium]